MRESTHFQLSQESFSRFAVPTMVFPLWHAHSSMDILSLISILYFWSVQSAMSALFHVLLTQACHSHVSLSFLFLQSSAMAIGISTRLWFPNTGILHLVYLIFLGCKLLYSSEMLLAVLSKNPFLTLQPHEIPLFCLLTCFFCTIFCKFLCHNVSFMLLSLLGNVTKHRYLYVHH